MSSQDLYKYARRVKQMEQLSKGKKVSKVKAKKASWLKTILYIIFR
jgi:hypothetical protein